MALPALLVLAVVSGVGAYAGQKVADKTDTAPIKNTESVNIPVSEGFKMSTSTMVGLSISAGVLLAVISKKGK